MDISVIILFYNESKNIPPLFEELRQVLPLLPLSYEILAIDDGSSDDTFALLKEEALKTKHLKVLRLRRNFGQTAALSAGFDQAEGDLIITMDGDLQNDPRDIPALIDGIR